jgi:hypothetical protein
MIWNFFPLKYGKLGPFFMKNPFYRSIYFSGCPKQMTGPNRPKKKRKQAFSHLCASNLQNGLVSRDSGN